MALSIDRFGRNVAAERTRKNWSQEDLAKACGLSQGSIARYEASLNYPTLESALSIAKALGCSIDYLVA